ncbi:hypothetical protein Ddye_006961 [Dipteronia dyeriana]|uniref:Uncharacterized protein n=1 Tax=Dipteronia dyeriana TaxID=168575 RepID=A0AAD9XK21_9ROSI|nr:hypothetical protein Ddye_006961 [Dipteronia dyeriana]
MGCGGSIDNEKGGVLVDVNVVGSSGHCGREGGEVNILREVFRMDCLEKRDHDSESTASSVVKDCNVVPSLGKGRMVKASGGRGENSKVHVDGFDKNGEWFVLDGMEKGGTSFVESGVNKLGSSGIKGDDRLVSLEDVESVGFFWFVCCGSLPVTMDLCFWVVMAVFIGVASYAFVSSWSLEELRCNGDVLVWCVFRLSGLLAVVCF